MIDDHLYRPSLLGKRKWVITPFSNVANILKDGMNEVSRPRQDIQEVTGGIMKLPDVKRPGLIERIVQPGLYGSQIPLPTMQ